MVERPLATYPNHDTVATDHGRARQTVAQHVVKPERLKSSATQRLHLRRAGLWTAGGSIRLIAFGGSARRLDLAARVVCLPSELEPGNAGRAKLYAPPRWRKRAARS